MLHRSRLGKVEHRSWGRHPSLLMRCERHFGDVRINDLYSRVPSSKYWVCKGVLRSLFPRSRSGYIKKGPVALERKMGQGRVEALKAFLISIF